MRRHPAFFFVQGGEKGPISKKREVCSGIFNKPYNALSILHVFGTLTLIFHLSHHIILGGKCQNKHKHDTY